MSQKNILVAEILNPESHGPFVKKYGIIVQSMQDTAVINCSSNTAGIVTNIRHGDYRILTPDQFKIHYGRVYVKSIGNEYVCTGLEIS